MAFDEDAFWSRLKPSGEHLLWTGGTSGGRGILKVDGQVRRITQVAWELANGEIPHGHIVVACPDDKLCAEPSHLSLKERRSKKPPKIKRSERGRGTMHKIGDKKWKIIVDAGRDDNFAVADCLGPCEAPSQKPPRRWPHSRSRFATVRSHPSPTPAHSPSPNSSARQAR